MYVARNSAGMEFCILKVSYNRGSGFEYNCNDFSQLDQLVQLKVFSLMKLVLTHTHIPRLLLKLFY